MIAIKTIPNRWELNVPVQVKCWHSFKDDNESPSYIASIDLQYGYFFRVIRFMFRQQFRVEDDFSFDWFLYGWIDIFKLNAMVPFPWRLDHPGGRGKARKSGSQKVKFVPLSIVLITDRNYLWNGRKKTTSLMLLVYAMKI